MRRPGEVLSQFQLLEHAWDYDYENRSNVVEVYVRYLREKIDRPFGVRSLETVRGAGYRLRKRRGRGGVSRLPIRGRLTAAFALAMVLVLAAAAVFVYLRLAEDLLAGIDSGLDVERHGRGTFRRSHRRRRSADPEEGFVQLVASDGRVLDSAGGAREAVLDRRRSHARARTP